MCLYNWKHKFHRVYWFSRWSQSDLTWYRICGAGTFLWVCWVFFYNSIFGFESYFVLKVANHCYWVDCKLASQKWINPSVIAKSCACLSSVLQLVRNTLDSNFDCRGKVRPYCKQFPTKIHTQSITQLVTQNSNEHSFIRHLVPGARWIQSTLSYLS